MLLAALQFLQQLRFVDNVNLGPAFNAELADAGLAFARPQKKAFYGMRDHMRRVKVRVIRIDFAHVHRCGVFTSVRQMAVGVNHPLFGRELRPFRFS